MANIQPETNVPIREYIAKSGFAEEELEEEDEETFKLDIGHEEIKLDKVPTAYV